MEERKRKTLFFVTFFTALLLLVATYAWLSSTLNVKIHFVQIGVDSTSGLFISLDGEEFDEEITISMDSVIMDLKEKYPNHTNQWTYGLWPVSTVGVRNPNEDKFDVYFGELIRTKRKNANGTPKRLLTTHKYDEVRANPVSQFVAFDVFFKNNSGSPLPDNLFWQDTTQIDYQEGTSDEVKEEMDGILNSVRIGIAFIGSVPHDAPLSDVQNVGCNNKCTSVIYEPYHLRHSKESIETAENYNITLKDNTYFKTYAIINEGRYIEHTSGHPETGFPLDTKHFKEQKTMKYEDFEQSIYKIPNGITKGRIYIWLEGQDIDSLETYSKGARLDVYIDFAKDLAGYEVE